MNIITRVSKQDGVWINLSTEKPVSPEYAEYLADLEYEAYADDEDLGPEPVCVPPCNETSNEDADADRAMYYSDQAIQALHDENMAYMAKHHPELVDNQHNILFTL